MNYNILAPTTSDVTFWDSAIRSKSVNAYCFSYYIDSTNTAGGMVFGGIDTARYHGKLNWVPIVPTASSFGQPVFVYWQIKMNSIEVGGTSVPFTPNNAVFDTGTSLAIFSPDTAKSINTNIGLKQIGTGSNGFEMYGVRCSSGEMPQGLPDVVLKFDYITISIPASTYLFIHPDDSGRLICISGIVGSTVSSSSSIILGNVILRQFYTVFDYGSRKIGIANADRSPYLNSSFVASDYRNSPVGTAPESLNGGIDYNGRSSGSLKMGNISILSLLGFILISWNWV